MTAHELVEKLELPTPPLNTWLGHLQEYGIGCYYRQNQRIALFCHAGLAARGAT